MKGCEYIELNVFLDYQENYIKMKKAKKRVLDLKDMANKEIEEYFNKMLAKYDDSIKIKSCTILFENDKSKVYLLLNKNIPFDFVYEVCKHLNFNVDYLVNEEIGFNIKEVI